MENIYTIQVPSLENYFTPKVAFKNRRDELIQKAVENINKIRASQNYQYRDRFNTVHKLKPETTANLAKRINMNPALAGSDKDDELELLLKKCEEKKDYRWLYAVTKHNA